ncbi:uncharacterized protein MONBRDRAFT_37051 [Monosiga brevicollis MX1]|uniref:Uncharacterized protein n=1 Tax=Monosiga brevicollis TaxID=81824 RepID=A9UZA4_MONBE|nr:uncharacterized protein MONBRDRAFT_37051 [Monosiga brevicollis MX1]EDQ89197.1 predicted protein [Monosiga brevicollis MX1]|eukprot:XP_001745773.1 hypothetical protein [Monosiga brevicollis MX1]
MWGFFSSRQTPANRDAGALEGRPRRTVEGQRGPRDASALEGRLQRMEESQQTLLAGINTLDDRLRQMEIIVKAVLSSQHSESNVTLPRVIDEQEGQASDPRPGLLFEATASLERTHQTQQPRTFGDQGTADDKHPSSKPETREQGVQCALRVEAQSGPSHPLSLGCQAAQQEIGLRECKSLPAAAASSSFVLPQRKPVALWRMNWSLTLNMPVLELPVEGDTSAHALAAVLSAEKATLRDDAQRMIVLSNAESRLGQNLQKMERLCRTGLPGGPHGAVRICLALLVQETPKGSMDYICNHTPTPTPPNWPSCIVVLYINSHGQLHPGEANASGLQRLNQWLAL